MAPEAIFEGPFGVQFVHFKGEAQVRAERTLEDDLMDLLVNASEVVKLDEARKKSWRCTLDDKCRVVVSEDSEGGVTLNGENVDRYEFETDSSWKLTIYPRGRYLKDEL